MKTFPRLIAQCLCLAGCLAACEAERDKSTRETDDAATQLADANGRSADEDASEPDLTQGDGAAAGSQRVDAATGSGNEAGTSDGSTKIDATSMATGDANTASVSDAAAAVDDADVQDAGVDTAIFVDQSGVNCHADDANGPLVAPRFINTTSAWPTMRGGSIVPGTYHLVLEERAARAEATEDERSGCAAYAEGYRESLTVTGGVWSRVTQAPGREGRQVLSLRVDTDKSELHLTAICPVALPASQPSRFLATSEKFVKFDVITRDFAAEGVPVCEIMYEYQRVP